MDWYLKNFVNILEKFKRKKNFRNNQKIFEKKLEKMLGNFEKLGKILKYDAILRKYSRITEKIIITENY